MQWEKNLYRTVLLIPMAVIWLNAGLWAAQSDAEKTNYLAELNKLGMAGRPQSDNAAPYYLKAIEFCVKTPSGLIVPTRIRPKELSAQEQALLREWVQDNSRAFEQLQLAGKKPYCWFEYTGQTLQNDMSRLATIRQLAMALQARAMLQAEDGNITGATNDIVTLYKFGAHFTDGPKTLVEKLVGIAVKSISIKAAFSILDRKMVDARLVKSLEDKFKQLVKEHSEPFDIRSEKLLLQEQVETNFAYRGFKPYLKSTLEYYDTIAAKTPWQLRNEETNSITEDNPLIETAGSAMPRVIEIEYRSRADVQALVTTLAVLRYRTNEGEYPAMLQELASAGYLVELPKDPYSNKPLVYRRTRESFALYSFGADFDDDGGLPSKWGSGQGGDQVFWPVERERTIEDRIYRPQARPGAPTGAEYPRYEEPEGMADVQSRVEVDLLADPNEIKARIKTFEGLEKALEQVTRKSQYEIRQWLQKRIDNRTSLAKAVQRQVKAELDFLQKLSVEERAKKTTAAIDGVLLIRQERLGKVIKKMEEGTRRRRQTRSPRGRYRGRYADPRQEIRTRGQLPAEDVTELFADPNKIQSKVKGLGGLLKTLVEVDRKSENEIQMWLQEGFENKANLAKGVHEQVGAEFDFIRKPAVEEGAKKTTAAIDGLMLARQKRFDKLVKKMEEDAGSQRQIRGPRSRRDRYSDPRQRYPQDRRTRGLPPEQGTGEQSEVVED